MLVGHGEQQTREDCFALGFFIKMARACNFLFSTNTSSNSELDPGLIPDELFAIIFSAGGVNMFIRVSEACS